MTSRVNYLRAFNLCQVNSIFTEIEDTEWSYYDHILYKDDVGNYFLEICNEEFQCADIFLLPKDYTPEVNPDTLRNEFICIGHEEPSGKFIYEANGKEWT